MPAGPVTDRERETARRQSRLLAPVERKSVTAAARLGNRLRGRVLSSYRRGRLDMEEIVAEEFRKVTPTLRDAFVLAYLLGVQESERETPARPIAAARTVHTDAMRVLERRLRIEPAALRELGDRYEAHAVQVLRKAENAVELKLQRAVRLITQEGMHVREGAKVLREAFDAAGLVPTNSFQLEAIFRTQTQMAYGAAKWQRDQDPEMKALLTAYKYIAIMDDRTRPEHAALDGTTLPVDDPLWDTIYPPGGFCCRCSAIRIFDERPPVHPPAEVRVEVAPGDFRLIRPGADEGFRFNPGKAFGDVAVRPGEGAKVVRIAVPVRVPPAPEWAPAATTAQAREWATEVLGVGEPEIYANIPVPAANVVNQRLWELKREGYNVDVRKIGRAYGNAYASASAKTLQLNPEYFKDLPAMESSVRASVTSGWHPRGCDTIASVITHEVGHVLTLGALEPGVELPLKTPFRSACLKVRRDYRKAQKAVMVKHGVVRDMGAKWVELKNDPTPQELRDPNMRAELRLRVKEKDKIVAAYRKEADAIFISQYADKNLNEFVAESFAMVKHAAVPSPFAAQIGRLVDELAKGGSK